MKKPLPPIISIIGTSAAGKTTLAKSIAKEFSNIIHVEIDILIRQEPENKYTESRSTLDIYKNFIYPILEKGNAVIIDYPNIISCSYTHIIPILLYTKPNTLLYNIRHRSYNKNNVKNKIGIMAVGDLLNPITQFKHFYTSNKLYSAAKVPIDTYNLKELKKILYEFLYLFESEWDLDNYIATLLMDLNVHHNSDIIDIYPRGIYADKYIIKADSIENKLKIFKKMIYPMLNLSNV
jgi:hypothetical protein